MPRGSPNVPSDPASYSHAPAGMLAHVSDNVGVVHALGETTAAIISHDWDDLAAWDGATIGHPSIVVDGELDASTT